MLYAKVRTIFAANQQNCGTPQWEITLITKMPFLQQIICWTIFLFILSTLYIDLGVICNYDTNSSLLSAIFSFIALNFLISNYLSLARIKLIFTQPEERSTLNEYKEVDLQVIPQYQYCISIEHEKFKKYIFKLSDLLRNRAHSCGNDANNFSLFSYRKSGYIMPANSILSCILNFIHLTTSTKIQFNKFSSQMLHEISPISRLVISSILNGRHHNNLMVDENAGNSFWFTANLHKNLIQLWAWMNAFMLTMIFISKSSIDYNKNQIPLALSTLPIIWVAFSIWEHRKKSQAWKQWLDMIQPLPFDSMPIYTLHNDKWIYQGLDFKKYNDNIHTLGVNQDKQINIALTVFVIVSLTLLQIVK